MRLRASATRRRPVTKADAKAWRDRLCTEIREGKHAAPKADPAAPLTFGDVGEQYLREHVRVSRRREKGRKLMELHIRLARETKNHGSARHHGAAGRQTDHRDHGSRSESRCGRREWRHRRLNAQPRSAVTRRAAKLVPIASCSACVTFSRGPSRTTTSWIRPSARATSPS